LIGENTTLKDLKKKSDAKIASLEDKIKDREAQGVKDKEKIKNLSLVQRAQELNKIYKTNQATATNTSVDLQGDLSQRVLETIYEADECQDIVADKDSIITEQKGIIKNSEKEAANFETMLNSAEKQIKQQKELQESADKNIDNLEKQNKKLRTKSTLNKIFTGIGIGVGVFIGTQL
jgi:flagellar motility protein MotE (MotC chaperone)